MKYAFFYKFNLTTPNHITPIFKNIKGDDLSGV